MELIDAGRYFAGLLFTFGLLAAGWLAMRRFAPGMVRKASATTNQLNILESLHLDTRRRVVRIQDGAREHVVLLGINSETLLESRAFVAPQTPKNQRANHENQG